MMNVEMNNCKMTNTQIGENNYMNIATSVSDDEWKKLELFFKERSEMVEKEYSFLAKEAENYVKKRDKKGLKEFIHRYVPEFTAGIFCNLASSGIVDLLQKFGIWL